MFILEDVSDTGARLVGDVPLAPGTPIAFEVPGTSTKGVGTVRYVQALQTSLAVLFTMGVQYDRGADRWYSGLRRALPAWAKRKPVGLLTAESPSGPPSMTLS
jgi:hypothetical protein